MNGKEQVIPNEEMKVSKSKFDQLEERKQEEIEKGRIINQNIAKITEEQVMVRGEYRYLLNKKVEEDKKASEKEKKKKKG